MKKRVITLVLAVVLALPLAACGQTVNPVPPDLTGHWRQVSDGAYYNVAVVKENAIRVYWHLKRDSKEYLYWTGTFEPPADGREPYTWVSQSNLVHEELFPWCRREETLTFTYKNGKLSFIGIQGRLHMTVAMEKVSELTNADLEAEDAT